MKTLLTLILIITTIGMMGQEWETDSTEIKLPVITLKCYNSASKTTPIEDGLFKLLTKYQTECYNDSTEVTYDWFEFDGKRYSWTPTIDPGINPNYIGTWAIWEHRQPTFTGFIQWLKERSKDE